VILLPVYAGAAGRSEVRCQCTPLDMPGRAVYVSGPPVGGLFQVNSVNIDDAAVPMRAIALGVIKAKVSSTVCVVILSGILSGVLSGMTPGARLFINTDGDVVPVVPTQPLPGSGVKRMVQRVGFALSADVAFISPEEPTRIMARVA
jgi:hypothetical protein